MPVVRVRWILLNRQEVRLTPEEEEHLLAVGCVVAERKPLVLLDVGGLAVVRGLLLDGGVGVGDLLQLRLNLVADLLGPVVDLVVAVVAATRQRQLGRELSATSAPDISV